MSGTSNPFAPPKREVIDNESLDIRDDLMGEDLLVTGPIQPGLSPRLEAPAEPWPTQNVGALKNIAVMGLHGGAGSTTLASMLGPDAAVEVGPEWPIAHSAWTDSYWPIPVIAVARTDHRGLAAASRFIRSWANEELLGSELSALVLVAAGPQASDARKKAIKRLLRMVPRGFHIPWIDAWLDGPPDPERLPLRIRRIIKHLQAPTK